MLAEHPLGQSLESLRYAGTTLMLRAIVRTST